MDDAAQFVVTPHTLTILTTYQCTAACTQCCFESSPQVKGALTLEQITSRVDEAKKEFPTLRLVVFSGGEAFLLKNDLILAVAHCHNKGLATRIVSNGSWAKTSQSAHRMCNKLEEAGLDELNISTGVDHQKWVPESSAINAVEAALNHSIRTVLTVEFDDSDDARLTSLMSNERIRDCINNPNFILQSNTWMPFKEDQNLRGQTPNMTQLRAGCEQIFGNIVVTPHDNLSACCGLTLEHIPEMRLGRCNGSNMGDLYRAQAQDFLKYWIHTHGPYSIIERVIPESASKILSNVVHICQACAILHQNVEVKHAISQNYEGFVSEVMTQFHIKKAVDRACENNEATSR